MYKWYRTPRTTQERRINCSPEHMQFVRAKRRPNNLADAWDDKPVHHQKTWKHKRKTQYFPSGRGKRREIDCFDMSWDKLWKIQKFFDNHNISYRIEESRVKKTGTRLITQKYVPYAKIPKYHYKWEWYIDDNGKKSMRKVRSHQIGYTTLYKTVKIDPPIKQTYSYYVRKSQKIIWWSNKVDEETILML